ncbi:hypothetical protein WJX73_001154 [Symbiochloris irregularis]|uniref:Telomeric single stranded DNA binding POT1/Cdc13 domain-containing protein n=1 Tax=Symbiochloris irregularis TaxID=706552 RepID=A0AAW1P4X1_9CHLO
MPEGGQPTYQYISLSDAYDHQGRQNCYAIVTEWTVPQRTKGTDYKSSFRLIDATLGSGQQLCTVELLVFGRRPDQHPQLRATNDIIRLHRVQVQMYKDRLQLVAKIGSPSQFLLFSHSIEATDEPYQLSSATYAWDDHESNLLRTLRQYINLGGLYGTRVYLPQRIRQIQPANNFDCTCLVLAVDLAPANGSQACLYIWDGTDAQPLPTGAEATEDFLRNIDVSGFRPQQALQQGDLPPLGTVLPVTLAAKDAHGQDLGPASLPPPRSWITLRRVAAVVCDSQLQGVYHSGSKWTPCEPDAEALAEDQRRKSVNNVAGWAPADPHELVATTQPHCTEPFATLRQIHRHASKQALQAAAMGNRYHCLVRVKGVGPSCVTEMCSRADVWGLTDASGTGSPRQDWIYAVQLRLEDATGELEALLCEEDGALFFQGILPQDMQQNAAAADALYAVMDRLRGTAEHSRIA